MNFIRQTAYPLVIQTIVDGYASEQAQNQTQSYTKGLLDGGT